MKYLLNDYKIRWIYIIVVKLLKSETKAIGILLIGVILVIFPAIIAILTIFGVIQPIIFQPTGKPLDIMPLVNVLCWYLMLLIVLYVGSRTFDWSINYMKNIRSDKN